MNKVIVGIFSWVGILILQLILLFYFKPTLVYTPYIYILLLFTISNVISRTQLLFSAFFLGLFIDIFTNSPGLNAFSAVLVIGLLPYITKVFSQQTLGDKVDFSVENIGIIRYGTILFILFLIYHLTALLLWNFSISSLFFIVFKSIVSSLIALFISFLIYSIFKNKKQEDNG